MMAIPAEGIIVLSSEDHAICRQHSFLCPALGTPTYYRH